MSALNWTHDPKLKSWVVAANEPDTDFPIQNLPFGIFRALGREARAGIAIGDQVFDLEAALAAGLFTHDAQYAVAATAGGSLNGLLELGTEPASVLRDRIAQILSVSADQSDRQKAEKSLVSMSEAEMLRPFDVTDFTDYSCSRHHIGRLSKGRPWPALHYLPIGYNGRRSSVQICGRDVRRPNGQSVYPVGSGDTPKFRPEPALDFELELGAILSGSNELGSPLTVDEAAARIFGYCLLNDWSARSIQMYEAALGPLLGKSFHTSISPWVVTDEALRPFKIAAALRTEGMPGIPDHLDSANNRAEGLLDIELEAQLLTPSMQDSGGGPVTIVSTNFKHMHWTFAQMIAHQASGGCNLGPGDLVGSGTVSGPDDEAQACLMEKTMMSGEPINLPNGEQRMWLEDGDELILRGRANREGFVSIGLGVCTGRIIPALTIAA